MARIIRFSIIPRHLVTILFFFLFAMRTRQLATPDEWAASLVHL